MNCQVSAVLVKSFYSQWVSERLPRNIPLMRLDVPINAVSRSSKSTQYSAHLCCTNLPVLYSIHDNIFYFGSSRSHAHCLLVQMGACCRASWALRLYHYPYSAVRRYGPLAPPLFFFLMGIIRKGKMCRNWICLLTLPKNVPRMFNMQISPPLCEKKCSCNISFKLRNTWIEMTSRPMFWWSKIS